MQCVRCGKTIPQERLEALPETRVCVKCSQAVGGEFKVYIVREKTSKEGSLKKNYGGVAPVFVRKTIRPMTWEERAQLEAEEAQQQQQEGDRNKESSNGEQKS